MRFASLGSGSGGNALVVEAGATRVLLDCGFTPREGRRRLARLGLEPGQLHAIVVTHEHGDHLGGAVALGLRHGIPLWMSHGTLLAANIARRDADALRLVDPNERFAIGDLEIEPYPVPHDAREPVQYAFGDGARRLGVLTDAGSATPHMRAVLSGCQALVLECNHDPQMLEAGPYPAALKRRIASRVGHLDNGASAALLQSLDCSRLQHVIAAHLSETNNTPALARDALAGALGCSPGWVGVADQDRGFGWREIG